LLIIASIIVFCISETTIVSKRTSWFDLSLTYVQLPARQVDQNLAGFEPPLSYLLSSMGQL